GRRRSPCSPGSGRRRRPGGPGAGGARRRRGDGRCARVTTSAGGLATARDPAGAGGGDDRGVRGRPTERGLVRAAGRRRMGRPHVRPGGRRGVVALVAATLVAQLLLLGPAPGWVTWAVGTAFTAGACAFARRQRQLVDELRSAQAELAEWARTDERHRIAREMHDLVGHGLTVTLLHLGSARLALEDDPAAVGASLAEAERAARGSLEDVRDAVATLRAEDGDTPVAGADVPSLVATYRLAGAPVDLRVRGGDLAGLPPASRVALYRVVQ